MCSISAMGLLCALGNNLDDISSNLQLLHAPGFKASDAYLVGNKTSYFGFIQDDLPLIDDANLKIHDSRNNRALLAAFLQIQDKVYKAIDKYGPSRVGIILGTTTSGIDEGDKYVASELDDKSYTSWTYEKQEIGDTALFLKKYLKLNSIAYSISTACSSSARAIISGHNLIKNNVLDAVIVGGVDTLARMPINGFLSLESLSLDKCEPFGEKRHGINIGEAAGLILLERDENSSLYIKGYGQSSDGYHISAPHPEGIGAKKCIQDALKMANFQPQDIGYINLHGTATPLNDKVEAMVIHDIFSNLVPCSSIKNLIGHTLGASGICEAIISLLILDKNLFLPCQNASHYTIDPSFKDFSLVQERGLKLKHNTIMSNTFAFGGNNVSIIFARK